MTGEALRDIIEISKEPWAIDYKSQEIRETLALIKSLGCNDALNLAQACVGILAAHGPPLFHDALGSSV